MSLADSNDFLLVLDAMAKNPGMSVRTVSETTGTPLPTVHRIARFFRFHRAMPRGRFDVRRGLRLAADLRRDKAVPDRTFHTHELYALISTIGRVEHHLAFASAANAIAQFEPTDTHIRIDASGRDVLARLKPLHSPRGAAVVHVYVDHLSRYPEPLRDIAASPVCDPLVTLIDMMSHPTGGAHAAFLDRTLTLAGKLPERPA